MNTDEHIAPDWLVGWTEGSLVDDERRQVEAHLARCRECREMATSLCSLPATAFRGRTWKRVLIAASVLVLGALGMRLATTSSLPSKALQLQAASAQVDLWNPVRSPTSGEEFYAGIQLASDADVRLLALMADGRLLPMPMDTAGSMHLAMAADSLHALGPYPRNIASVLVERLIIIQTQAPMDADWFSALATKQVADAAALAELVATLASKRQARVDSISMLGESD